MSAALIAGCCARAGDGTKSAAVRNANDATAEARSDMGGLGGKIVLVRMAVMWFVKRGVSVAFMAAGKVESLRPPRQCVCFLGAALACNAVYAESMTPSPQRWLGCCQPVRDAGCSTRSARSNRQFVLV